MGIRKTLVAAASLGCLLLAGCTPALNWHQTQASGADLGMTLPCKPQHVSRPIALAGAPTTMTMTGCEAAGLTFALGWADLPESSRADAALAQLQAAALSNLGGRVLSRRPAEVARATAGLAHAEALQIAGSGPDGAALREHLLLFAQGRRVFQALVLGPAARPQDDAARSFANSLTLGPAP